MGCRLRWWLGSGCTVLSKRCSFAQRQVVCSLPLPCVPTPHCRSTLSRGEVDFTIGATFCGAGREDPLVCTAARAVHVLAPTWRPQAAGE